MSRAIEDLVPEVQPLLRRLLAACEALQIRVVITSTRRTTEEQAELYALGRTRPGKVVTNAKPGTSRHESGEAFDLAFLDKEGNATWDGPWATVGGIAQNLGLVWGGNWNKFRDLCHFELPKKRA